MCIRDSSDDLSALWERLETLPEESGGAMSESGQPARPSTRSLLVQLEGEAGGWSTDPQESSARPPMVLILVAAGILLMGIGLGFWL